LNFCFRDFQVCIFCYRDATVTTDHSFFVTPSFRSLERNNLGRNYLGRNKFGRNGGIAIAEALKINKTITNIK
jgi:hypothetical protein